MYKFKICFDNPCGHHGTYMIVYNSISISFQILLQHVHIDALVPKCLVNFNYKLLSHKYQAKYVNIILKLNTYSFNKCVLLVRGYHTCHWGCHITHISVVLFLLFHVSLIMIINYLNNINFILSHTILVTFSQYHKHYQYDKN